MPTTDFSLLFPDGQGGVKQCDGGLALRSRRHSFSPIIYEVGVSESHLDLKRDAWDWLWGSEGIVRVVILVKLKKPPQGLIAPSIPAQWAPAFVEVWERLSDDEAEGRRYAGLPKYY